MGQPILAAAAFQAALGCTVSVGQTVSSASLVMEAIIAGESKMPWTIGDLSLAQQEM
jgi:hypothetical protein